MGADPFYVCGFGEDVDDAFCTVVERERRKHGQGGYSGTIADKNSVELIPDDEHKGKQKMKFAEDLVADGDERIKEKRGPAGAIDISGTKRAKNYRERRRVKGKHGNVYLFFGFAPS